MAITAAQTRRSKASAATASLAIGSGDGWVAPTAGNLIVVTANSDATVSTPSGYTLGPSVVDGNAAYVFWKIAAGTETTVTVTPGSSAATAMTACEYAGTAASPLDVSNSSTIAATTGSTTTAVSVTTTAVNDLIISAAMVHHNSGSGLAPVSPVWTNSFVNQLTVSSGTAMNNCYIFYAELVVTAAAAYSSQCSWTNTMWDRQQLTIAFKELTGAVTTAVPRRRRWPQLHR